MATFCGKCGSPLIDNAVFCGNCGTSVSPGVQPAVQADLSSTRSSGSTAANENTKPTPVSVTPVAKSSNSLLKVVVAFVAIIFVGGVLAIAAVFYAAHKASEKIHSLSQQALGAEKPVAGGLISTLAGSTAAKQPETQGPGGNLCRFLSKQDVSKYTGTKIIRADSVEGGCVYVANGDPADAITKHLGGMMGQQGADPKTQQTMEKIAGGFFQQQEHDDKSLSAQAKKGEIPILTIDFSSGDAVSEMKLNHKMLARMNSQDLVGIGDEAFNSADGIMTVRKGNTLFRMTYISCPCTSDAIKPLAQKLANAL
jgi:hypothetical protein